MSEVYAVILAGGCRPRVEAVSVTNWSKKHGHKIMDHHE